MSRYKLTYLHTHGRAEIIRLVLAVAGAEYEDCKVDLEQWADLRPQTPFGQLPILEEDGVVLCQSNAIARYLAKKYGLAGKTDLDQARADMIVDSMDDIARPLVTIFKEQNANKKAELLKRFTNTTLPEFLDNLQKILDHNGSGGSYLVGDDMSWADLAAFHGFSWIKKMELWTVMEQFPKLLTYYERMSSHAKIEATTKH